MGFDVEFINADPDILIAKTNAPKYNIDLNLVFLICLLVTSASILCISLACTTCHCYRKVNTDEENDDTHDGPRENILLRAGSKILWEGRLKKPAARPERWI